MADATVLRNGLHESRSRRLLFFVLAFAYLLAYLLILEAADRVQVWAGLPGPWFEKFVSIGFSCSVLACSPWLRENVGLRWRQSPGSARLSIGCFVAFLGLAIGFGFLIPPVAFSAERLAFQFIIPGMDEELMLRGIMLALLERAFGQSPMSCRLRIGYAGLITSLVFGVGHAVSIKDGQLHFAALLFSTTTLWAAIAALVRTRSGSLLWPVILHNTWNGSIFLVGMLR